MNTEKAPLIAKHLEAVVHIDNNDYVFDDHLGFNLTEDGGLACSRSSRPYTNAQTPSHMIPAGYTPSGKWKPARSVPSKMDRRVGK